MSLADVEPRPPASEDPPDLATPVRTVTVGRVAVMRWAVGATALVSLASVALTLVRVFTDYGQLLGLIQLFNIEQDGSLPSVLSAALMLGCAAVAWAGAQESAGTGGSLRRHWRFLALAFVVLAVDELAGLHMALGLLVQKLVGAGTLEDMVWAAGIGLLIVVAILAYVPFLRRLPRPTATRFILAGIVYVAAAVVVDTAAGVLLRPLGAESLSYAVASLCEEITEMVGLLLFLDAGLRHLGRADAASDLRLGFLSP